MPRYHFSKTVTCSFDEAIDKVTRSLKESGFGVLTSINVQGALKEKIGVDFRPYTILGACNPHLANEALAVEDKIGTMLPCNVVVQKHEDGRIEVSAVDPLASMIAIENVGLESVALKARPLLKAAIDRVA